MMSRHYRDYDAIDWLRIAYRNARDFSDDKSTQCGSVLVSADRNHVTFGANHLPKGVEKTHDRITTRPDKYLYMEHAERDSIYTAALRGMATVGATLYAPWFACPDCARAIIGCGIARVVGHISTFDRTPERWREPIDVGDTMLEEAGVELTYIDEKLFVDGEPFGEGHPEPFQVLFNGKWWVP